MTSTDHPGFRKLCENRKARRDYAVLDQIEVGIALVGTEVKSLRLGEGNLTGGHAGVDQGQLWLYGVSIPAYAFGNRFNHEPDRPRRLLAHRKEIDKLKAQAEQKGLTLIPLSLYLKNRTVKVQLGLCKGKTHGDKRDTLRAKDEVRETQRAMKQR